MTAPRSGGSRRLRAAFVAAMLLALAVQAVFSALGNSSTFDEPEHIASGMAALRTRDFRMSVAHPPLMDMLCAAAAAAGGAPPPPVDSEFWRTRNQLAFANIYLFGGPHAAEAPRLVFLARLPVIAVSMGLALLVFFWARRL